MPGLAAVRPASVAFAVAFAFMALALPPSSGCGGKGKGASEPGTPSDVPGAVTAVVEGNPAHFVVRVTHDGAAKVLVDVPAEVERFDNVTADVSPVQGSDDRVFLVQRFGESGEDEFSRDIEAWVIDAARNTVLWTGHGSFSNSFGECETLEDIPEAAMESGDLVVRVVKGVEKLEPESDRCESVPFEKNEVVRITLR